MTWEKASQKSISKIFCASCKTFVMCKKHRIDAFSFICVLTKRDDIEGLFFFHRRLSAIDVLG